jgi:hypothetical protein
LLPSAYHWRRAGECEPQSFGPMLCGKCHKNEATVHFTIMVETEEERVDLCKDCAPARIAGFDLAQAKAQSIIGQKCHFCGAAACSGEMVPGGGAIYWCFDCGAERMSIATELLRTERPDLLQPSKEPVSFLSSISDSDFQTWAQAASRKSVELLKDKRRQDGRDKGS